MAAKTKKPRVHPLDAVGAAWTPPYNGARKPLVLMNDAEVFEKFGRHNMEPIWARNTARDVAEALARANGRLRDIGAIASKQIRTKFDGGIFSEILHRPFHIALWFENAGPLSDAVYYPAFGKVYDQADENLKKLGGYKKAQWESYNSAVTIFYVEPEIWS